MKKYMIFMGALALAACNNGSSHHTGAGDIIPQPVAPAIDMPANVQIQNATYTGTAVAYVESEMPGKVVNKITQTNDASLVFDNTGNHTLTMKFSKADNPWYDVIVKNGTNISLAGGDNIDQDFMVTDAMLKSLKDAYFSQQYFGESGDPSEVVYRVGFETKDRTTGREIEFDGAFGGKRQ